MFKTRLLSGIVLIGLAVGTVLLGGPVLLVTVAFLTFVGMWELYSAVGLTGAKLAEKKGLGKMSLLLGAAYVGAASYMLTLYFLPERYIPYRRSDRFVSVSPGPDHPSSGAFYLRRQHVLSVKK